MVQANVNYLISSHVLCYGLFQGIEAQMEIKLLCIKTATLIKKC